MAEKAVPKPPAGLKTSGRRLWRAVMSGFVLDQHEETLLREACRTADLLDELQTIVEAEGPMSASSQGVRVHPAAVELRQQRIAFARLLTGLRIPTGDENDERTQRRGGPRGVYGLRAVD